MPEAPVDMPSRGLPSEGIAGRWSGRSGRVSIRPVYYIFEERRQGVAVFAPPGDTSLAVDVFEVFDQKYREENARRNASASRLGLARVADLLDVTIKLNRIKYLVETIAEGVPRSRNERLGGDPKLFLPLTAASAQSHSNTPNEGPVWVASSTYSSTGCQLFCTLKTKAKPMQCISIEISGPGGEISEDQERSLRGSVERMRAIADGILQYPLRVEVQISPVCFLTGCRYNWVRQHIKIGFIPEGRESIEIHGTMGLMLKHCNIDHLVEGKAWRDYQNLRDAYAAEKVDYRTRETIKRSLQQSNDLEDELERPAAIDEIYNYFFAQVYMYVAYKTGDFLGRNDHSSNERELDLNQATVG